MSSPLHSGRPGCFLIAPFKHKGSRLHRAIRDVCRTADCECRMSLDAYRMGNVMKGICEDIENARIVVADLTGLNANVFYEIAIAHHRLGHGRVILIARKGTKVPFDLQENHYVEYVPSRRGLVKFRQDLAKYVARALSDAPGKLFESIESKEERTRRIVADLVAWRARGPEFLATRPIRAFAGLSALSIRTEEPQDAPPKERPYRDDLVAERDALRDVVKAGARLKLMLCPPVRAIRKFGESDVLEGRYERLIAALAGDTGAQDDSIRSDRSEIVLSPMAGANLYVFGEAIQYEGHKAGLFRGFELTQRTEQPALIQAHVRAFDRHFQQAVHYTLKTYAPRGAKGPDALRTATLKGLRRLRDQYLAASPRAVSGSA